MNPDINSKSLTSSVNKEVEIEPEKTLKFISTLSDQQTKMLTSVLKKHKTAFTWDYSDMRGLHPNFCTHHIYTKDDCIPIRQP